MIPLGFTFSSINAGVKSPSHREPDMGLIVCSQEAVLSGVFTRNLVKAAPVLIGMEQAMAGKARAVIANAGNANACTGQQGMDDARSMMQTLGKLLNADPDTIVPLSTGTIGVPMPMNRIIPKLAPLADGLGRNEEAFAKSIMTTDTFPKIVCRRAGEANVLGFAKGAGMIAPDMATTLAVVLTDAVVSKQYLDNIIVSSVEETFNAITVDGDTSTNDTLIALASGMVPVDPEILKQAVFETIRELALMIVADGEGATKVVEVTVRGTATDHDAKRVAMSIADSLLVKTALFGADPNWGRIACAAGYSGANFDPDRLGIRIQDLNVVENGRESSSFLEEDLHRALLEKNIRIEVDLGDGPGRFTAWTTDLSYRYVEINSQYRT